ncbi:MULTISPECIES: hypothetical protein [unclassified Candidatus Tisiphia]|uniref:hypothetical protein n=1 Tax=unclassified Candidatus Tisiphia TaxID=2996318 RepID=UPI00312C706E
MLSNKKITSTVAEVEMAKAELEAKMAKAELEVKVEETIRIIKTKMAEAKIVETQIQKDNNLYPFSELFKLSADDNNVAKHDEHTPMLGNEEQQLTE